MHQPALRVALVEYFGRGYRWRISSDESSAHLDLQSAATQGWLGQPETRSHPIGGLALAEETRVKCSGMNSRARHIGHYADSCSSRHSDDIGPFSSRQSC